VSDIFDDMNNIRMPCTGPEEAPAPGPNGTKHQSQSEPKVAAKAAQSEGARFVRVPLSWKARLLRARGAAYGLALEILDQVFRTGKSTIVVSNVLAGRVGLTHKTKPRALKQLEHRGLVRVERTGKKSPRVTVLTPKHPEETPLAATVTPTTTETPDQAPTKPAKVTKAKGLKRKRRPVRTAKVTRNRQKAARPPADKPAPPIQVSQPEPVAPAPTMPPAPEPALHPTIAALLAKGWITE
jgi:hypothetical protein